MKPFESPTDEIASLCLPFQGGKSILLLPLDYTAIKAPMARRIIDCEGNHLHHQLTTIL